MNVTSDLDTQAALWVARMDAEDWDSAADAELGLWLARDPRNRGALLHAQALWVTLGRAEDQDQCAGAGEAAYKPLQTSRRRLLGGLMAGIAASVAGGLVLLNRREIYETQVGEIRRVPLADGSIAAINTASAIKVALADTRRDIELEQGEAWFQVAKDPQRPFLVSAGRVRVVAIGTAFAVRRHANGAEIVVTEGVVKAWAAGAEGHKVELAAGSRAFVADDAAISRAVANAPAADRALAWRSGKIDLAGTRIEDAVAEFNRYNHRKIVLRDTAVGDERVDGVFRTDDPEGFARVVGGSFAVPVELGHGNEIRIGSAADQKMKSE
jgi:transmembrane sensor